MTHANHTARSGFMKTLLPILIALVLVCGTVLLAGSTLYQIEDVYVNRILSGSYGTPDWRVLEMNPLLSQLLSLLYRLAPVVNWYGALLLLLLGSSCALLMRRAARESWGLIPVAMAISPILILLSNAVHSQSVCALCTVMGTLAFADALKQRRTAAAIEGALFLLFGILLSLQLAALLVICMLICLLPGCLRDKRNKSLFASLPVILAMFLLLAGYSALNYSSPELSAYRKAAMQYDQLQHSSLRAAADDILDEYHTMSTFYQATSEDPAADLTQWVLENNTWFSENLGWSMNDISIFTERKGVDLALVDPQLLSSVADEVSYVSTDPSMILDSLLETAQKPQFILLIAIFLLCALALVLSNHRKVLLTLAAAAVSFGGHLLMLACYRDSFGSISPFYLLGISVLLNSFSGEDAKAWAMRRLPWPVIRRVLAAVCCLVFACGIAGIVYYQSSTAVNNAYTVDAINGIYEYTQSHPEILFIGDNPCERLKPDTLDIPVRGQDSNILAGSYDLYSPRATEQMERFGVTNPLSDCQNNDQIHYINMSFYSTMRTRLGEAYGAAYIIFDNSWSKETTSSMIMGVASFATEEEYLSYVAENELVLQEMESTVTSHEGHDHDHSEEGTETDHDHE